METGKLLNETLANVSLKMRLKQSLQMEIEVDPLLYLFLCSTITFQ